MSLLSLFCRVFRDQFVLLWDTKRERIVDGVLTGRTENGMMGCFLETDSNISLCVSNLNNFQLPAFATSIVSSRDK
ncbi:hypothetical protein NC651_034789 [Populus alba x Populus x berolinensis]|nr:hypothetical protein NC651_034789 [Populus alba x Populus x berolinensis]